MITISVRYHSLLRRASGVADEIVTLPLGTSLYGALEHLAQGHGPSLRGMLLGLGGGISPHLVVFRNGSLVSAEQRSFPLADGDELMLFLAIAGG